MREGSGKGKALGNFITFIILVALPEATEIKYLSPK